MFLPSPRFYECLSPRKIPQGRDDDERQRQVVKTALDLIAEHGDRSHYEAILFATMIRDGMLFEPRQDAQFWSGVVLEVGKRTARSCERVHKV